MQRRRVLIISYYFPPINSGGTFRLLKFAKYLPEFGWDPIVVSARPTEDDQLDLGLVAELPPSVIIERVGHLHPKQIEKGLLVQWTALWKLRLRTLATQLEPYKVLPWIPLDPYLAWTLPAFRAAQALVQQHQPDVVMTSTPPHSGQLVGLWLKRATGLPWVADFRDPWSHNPFIHFPSRFHASITERVEEAVFRHADHIVAVTKSMTNQMSGRGAGKYVEKLSTIENGFDAADFISAPAVQAQRARLHIAYVGSLYGLRRADLFLKCVDRLVESGQIPQEKVLVELVGKDGTGIVESYADRVWFRYTPPQPHAQALQTMMSADLLLLLVPPNASYIHSGKLFEYLGARKPILALAPLDSEAARVVLEAGVGVAVPPDDGDAICAALLDLHEAWSKHRLRVISDGAVVNSFERRHLTENLVRVLEAAIASCPTVNPA